MKVALLGLPQSGKKTFFFLLTGRKVSPGVRKEEEALEGIAPIRDQRVDVLAGIFKPEKTKYAENAIVLCPDIDPKSADAGRAWLENARKCDMICFLIREFSSAEIYHPLGSVDANRDRNNLETEIAIADLEMIEKRLERIAKEKKSGQNPAQVEEEKTLLKIKEKVEKDMHFPPDTLGKQELDSIKSLNLLTLKPLVFAYNVNEDSLAKQPKKDDRSLVISCRIEEEIMALNKEDRQIYLKDLGVSSSGLDRLNQTIYDSLGLMSFYTVGPDEVRAWTIRKGATAPEAAGKIHSDIERGFIRAEIIKYDDLVAAGSEAAVKAQGKTQLKGRDYVIQDGDICHFRFNV